MYTHANSLPQCHKHMHAHTHTHNYYTIHVHQQLVELEQPHLMF